MSEVTLEPKGTEDATSAQPAPAEVSNDTAPELETKDESKQEGDVDYKALLELERARTRRAEEKIVKLKKTAKVEEAPAEDLEERIAALVEERTGAIKESLRSELLASSLETELSGLSSNNDERELIKFIYENKIVKSSDLKQDLLDAKLLANKTKILQTNAELEASLRARATTSTAPASGASAKQPAPVELPKDVPSDVAKWAAGFAGKAQR